MKIADTLRVVRREFKEQLDMGKVHLVAATAQRFHSKAVVNCAIIDALDAVAENLRRQGTGHRVETLAAVLKSVTNRPVRHGALRACRVKRRKWNLPRPEVP